MEHNSPTSDQPLSIPPIVWFLGLGLIAALVAIFVFNVTINTAVYYGFFALMVGSHLFMHGSHGGHGAHAGHQSGTASKPAEGNRNEHSGHSGGCH